MQPLRGAHDYVDEQHVLVQRQERGRRSVYGGWGLFTCTSGVTRIYEWMCWFVGGRGGGGAKGEEVGGGRGIMGAREEVEVVLHCCRVKVGQGKHRRVEWVSILCDVQIQ